MKVSAKSCEILPFEDLAIWHNESFIFQHFLWNVRSTSMQNYVTASEYFISNEYVTYNNIAFEQANWIFLFQF